MNEDTVKLLRECNAGVKMGVSSIDDVLPHVHSKRLEQLLIRCKEEHEKLGNETRSMLNQYGDSGKEPNMMAKGMSWIKTNVMISLQDDDSTIADLMTDGCDMGVKSLHRYLNQYKDAEPRARQITQRLSRLEEQLVLDLRSYL